MANPRRWTGCCSATTSSSASTTCRRRRRARRRCASRTLEAVIDVLDAAHAEGVRTFMCTTHDRIALSLRHRAGEPERYAGLPLLSRHALRPQVRQRGDRERDARRGQTLPPGRGPGGRGRPGRHIAGEKGRRGDDDAADRRRDEDVRRPEDAGDLPAERRRRPVARPRLRRAPSRCSPTTSATATTPSRASSR